MKMVSGDDGDTKMDGRLRGEGLQKYAAFLPISARINPPPPVWEP